MLLNIRCQQSSKFLSQNWWPNFSDVCRQPISYWHPIYPNIRNFRWATEWRKSPTQKQFPGIYFKKFRRKTSINSLFCHVQFSRLDFIVKNETYRFFAVLPLGNCHPGHWWLIVSRKEPLKLKTIFTKIPNPDLSKIWEKPLSILRHCWMIPIKSWGFRKRESSSTLSRWWPSWGSSRNSRKLHRLISMRPPIDCTISRMKWWRMSRKRTVNVVSKNSVWNTWRSRRTRIAVWSRLIRPKSSDQVSIRICRLSE